MKKGLILIALLALSVGLFGQNKFKYQVQATGGLSVGAGGDTVKLDSVIYSDARLKFYRGASELSTIGTGAQIATIVPLLADTIPIFVFGGGGGNAGDTAAFTTSTIYGSFFNEGSDTLAITSLRVVMLGDATDTLSVDILWDVNLNDSSPTELNSDPFPVNSFTTGDEDTSFAAYKIPPDSWVWCKTPGVVAGRKPTYFNAQISGYKIPRY